MRLFGPSYNEQLAHIHFWSCRRARRLLILRISFAGDLAFVVEAIIINGYIGASHWSPSKFLIRRLRDFWTDKHFEEWTFFKEQHPDATPDALQKAVTREKNVVEHTFVGARWRR